MKCENAEIVWNKTLISELGPEEARKYWKNMTSLNHAEDRNYYNSDLACVKQFKVSMQILILGLGYISMLALGLIEPVMNLREGISSKRMISIEQITMGILTVVHI